MLIVLGPDSDIPFEFEPDEKRQAVLEEGLSCYQVWLPITQNLHFVDPDTWKGMGIIFS